MLSLFLVAACLAAVLVLPTRAEAKPDLVPLTCAPTADLAPTGAVEIQLVPFLPPVEVPLPQLGQPIADALSGVQLPLPIPVDVDATPEIEPGGTVDYTTGVGFGFHHDSFLTRFV
jgi:hypothetical protein